jgi:hypothetical protein
MIGRITLAGLILAMTSLATGCCHHQSLCQSSCASPAVSRAPCCPSPAGAAAVPGAPVPVQAYSSPVVSY